MKKMKQYIKISLILLIGFITFSCDTNDEILTDNNQNAMENDIALITTHNGNGRANSNYSMLYFKSMKIFHMTIDNLEKKAEELDDAFIAAHPRLDADELTIAETELGFDSYEAFINFEKKYKFKNSMFRAYRKAEENWLNTPELDPNTDPDTAFLDLEPEQLVVLNDDGAVQIGNDIYQIYNGGTLIFNNTSVDTFAGALDFSGLDFSGLDFGITWGDIGFDWGNIYGGTYDYTDVSDYSSNNNCIQQATEREHWSIGNRKRLKGIVKITHNTPWGAKLKSKSKYYKKRLGRWWNNRASSLTAAIDGSIDESCGNNIYVFYKDVNQVKKTSKKKAKYTIHPSDIGYDDFYLAPNALDGAHRKGGGNWKYQSFYAY
jgi:hypothetical protein